MGTRMRGVIHRKQSIVRDHRVHLRRRDRGMTKQLLDSSDVGSMVEHVRCARVAKYVGRKPIAQSGSITVFAHDCPCSLTTQPTPTSVEEYGVGIGTTSELLWRDHSSAFLIEPLSERNTCEAADRDNAFFRTFTEEPQQPRVEIHITQTQRTHFRDSSARSVQDLEDGAISTSDSGLTLDLIEQGTNLGLGQCLG